MSHSTGVKKRRRPSSSSTPCLAPRCSGSAGTPPYTWAPAARWQPCWGVRCSRTTGSAGNTSGWRRTAARTPPGRRRKRWRRKKRRKRSPRRSWTGPWSTGRRRPGRRGGPWTPDPGPEWRRRSNDPAVAAGSGCPARCCQSLGSPPASLSRTWRRLEDGGTAGQVASEDSDWRGSWKLHWAL